MKQPYRSGWLIVLVVAACCALGVIAYGGGGRHDEASTTVYLTDVDSLSTYWRIDDVEMWDAAPDEHLYDGINWFVIIDTTMDWGVTKVGGKGDAVRARVAYDGVSGFLTQALHADTCTSLPCTSSYSLMLFDADTATTDTLFLLQNMRLKIQIYDSAGTGVTSTITDSLKWNIRYMRDVIWRQ